MEPNSPIEYEKTFKSNDKSMNEYSKIDKELVSLISLAISDLHKMYNHNSDSSSHSNTNNHIPSNNPEEEEYN